VLGSFRTFRNKHIYRLRAQVRQRKRRMWREACMFDIRISTTLKYKEGQWCGDPRGE
jgi:hypothetical protein